MADGASGKKLFTQEELNAKVLEANLYLADNLHEAFTPDDLDEARELLGDSPEGYVSSVGKLFVRIPEKLWKLQRNPLPVAEARALAVLLLTECAEAEVQREEQAREDASERNGAGAVTP